MPNIHRCIFLLSAFGQCVLVVPVGHVIGKIYLALLGLFCDWLLVKAGRSSSSALRTLR